MKPRLIIRVPACEEVPAGYGLVYVDYLRNESIHALVPLNLPAAWIRAAWLWVLFGFYGEGMKRRERMHQWHPTHRFRWGLRCRWGSFWIGAHWSSANRRLCINLIPCVTVWIVAPGGVTP